jgi:hypothetical protein
MDAATYYRLTFSLVNHYQYGIQDIEQLYPYERDIYYELLADHIKQTEERRKSKDAGAGLG